MQSNNFRVRYKLDPNSLDTLKLSYNKSNKKAPPLQYCKVTNNVTGWRNREIVIRISWNGPKSRHKLFETKWTGRDLLGPANYGRIIEKFPSLIRVINHKFKSCRQYYDLLVFHHKLAWYVTYAPLENFIMQSPWRTVHRNLHIINISHVFMFIVVFIRTIVHSHKIYFAYKIILTKSIFFSVDTFLRFPELTFIDI